jgi:hypothetical protein
MSPKQRTYKARLLTFASRLPVHSEDGRALGMMNLTSKHKTMLRQHGEIVQQGKPTPEWPLISTRPDSRLTAWQLGLIVLRHSYQNYRLDEPLLTCIAGAEFLHQVKGFEPKDTL